jgi:hypothetical protein
MTQTDMTSLESVSDVHKYSNELAGHLGIRDQRATTFFMVACFLRLNYQSTISNPRLVRAKLLTKMSLMLLD